MDLNTKASRPKYKVPFVSLNTPEKERQLKDIFEGIKGIYDSSQFVMGSEVTAFEREYAKLAGCQFGIGVNSGTDAMLLALRALGVGSGDEVITAANSFVATGGAIALTGATPVFADVRDDYNLDPARVEAAITKRTKAILVVHLTGNPCAMDPILDLAKEHNLFVVEDAAQAIGAKYKGKFVGGLGDCGCFSLHPLKNLHVWGDAGMATTNSVEMDQRLRQQRNHGLKNRDEVDYFSFNSRLDSIQAVVGLHSIQNLQSTIERRRKNAKIYDEKLKRLSGYVTTPIVSQDVFATYHLYVIAAERRDLLRKFLDDQGIETKVHYPIPIHLQRAAYALKYKKGDLPVTESLAKKIVSLPIRESLAEEEIQFVCDAIKEFYDRSVS